MKIALRHTGLMGTRRLVVGLTLLIVAVCASPAAAQQSIFVDPDSPTGAEYDIPLERARRDASPDPQSANQSYRSSSAPLFGSGIETGSDGGGKARTSSPSSSGARGSRSTGKKAQRSRRSGRRGIPEAVQAAIRQPGAPDGGIGTTLLFGGAGLLVLLLGGAVGIALRRARD